jgi:hypothetical protein
MVCLRKCVVYCLLAVLPVNSWATGQLPCAENAGAGAPDAHLAAAHQHFSEDHSAGSHANHGLVGHDQKNDPSDKSGAHTDCPSCDTCESPCAASSCTSVVAAAGGIDSMIDPVGLSPIWVSRLHQGPARERFLRPPIQLI